MKRELLMRFAAVGTAFLVAVTTLGSAYRTSFSGKPTVAVAIDDKSRLQGSWRIVEARTRETGPKRESFPFQRIWFRGDKFTFEGPNSTREATFRLDASVVPAVITLTFGRDYQAEVRVGTYALDADTLSLKLSDAPGRGRPGGMANRSESGALYLNCQREPDN